MIDGAAKWLSVLKNQKGAERPFIHLTFLDAYTRDATDDMGYGSLPDYSEHFSEHYVDVGLWFTDAMLQNAFNFNITRWKPVSSHEKRDAGHQWPRYWYQKTVTTPGFAYGYHLSRGGGNELFHN